MKNVERMRTEYRREELGKGVRGKHYAEFKKGNNLVLLMPEVAKIFPSGAAISAALDSQVDIARSATSIARRSARTLARASRAA